jgi:DNA invertase Pin-like site-specific DNA recombinase
LVSGGVSN